MPQRSGHAELHFTSPRLSGGGLGSTFSSSQRPSIVLLAPILMAWNRDESSPSYGGYTAAAAGAAASAGDEATFRALLARQLQGLLGGSARPAWRRNHRGEHSLLLE